MSKQAQAQKPKDEAKPKIEPELSMTAAQKKVVAGLTTVSARIRYLDSEGYSRSQITKLIPNAKGDKLLYQHVRNVLVSPAPKAS